MNTKHWMYLSLWKEHDGAPGLGLFSFDCATGDFALCSQLDRDISFGCSYFDKRRKILYICNEVEKVPGVSYETGRIYGYRVSPLDGSLTELFHLETCCANPNFVSLDPSGSYMVVANYGLDGAIAKLKRDETGKYAPELIFRDSVLELFSVNEDGTPGELLDVKKHEVDRQLHPRGSRLHCTVFSPSGNFFVVCDKGSGQVHLYTIDRESNTLKLLSSTYTSAPDACPRYCVFHPEKPYFVVNHEKERDGRMVLSSFRYTEDGLIEEVSSVDVLPPNYEIPPGSHYEQQGLCISPDGKYVYTCLKGPNAIAVLSLDESSGRLRLLQHAPITGIWPRGLALAPDGRHVFSSCLVSGDIAVYAAQEDGLLRSTGKTAKLKGGTYMSFCEATP